MYRPLRSVVFAALASAAVPATLPTAFAADRACLPPADPEMERLRAEADDPDLRQQVEISADDADLLRDGVSRLSGNVRIRSRGRMISADAAEYDTASERLSADGAVTYMDGNLLIRSERAGFDGATSRVDFEQAQFRLPARPARGGAERLQIRADRTVQLQDVFYTSCPEGNEDWRLLANNIDLDAESGFGTARNVRVEFFNIPILYTPWITFPITDERKTGFLFPSVGRSNRTGEDISIPYYLNLAPNYDAMFTPRIMTRRGVQLESEFRYLTRSSSGDVEFDFLPSDRVADRNRRYTRLRNTSALGQRLRLTLDGEDVSDSEYFEDLGGGVGNTSRTHLDRRLDLEYATDSIFVLGRFQGYQTLDEAIEDLDRPYRRLPQLLFEGRWHDIAGGLDTRLDAEIVNFDRESGVTGWRFDATPTVSRRFGHQGLYATPAVGIRHTRYELSDTAAGADSAPTRTVPEASLDLGAIFERQLGNGYGVQTLEPRVRAAWIPFRDQDELPIFDTILPDFDLVQLYRNNRFLGADRVTDTRQVSAGVTTRVLDESSGIERLRLTLGQTRYLADQRVTLPGEAPLSSGSAEYIGELGLRLGERWRANVGYQWNSELSATTRAEAGIQFRPDDNRVLNLAYRFRRGLLEQSDVSFSWPLAERWNLVGRYNYSWRDETTLDRFAGLEYEACCFALRLVLRRYVSRRTGESDTAINLQIELKGLASVGDPADDFLERGILGYGDLR